MSATNPQLSRRVPGLKKAGERLGQPRSSRHPDSKPSLRLAKSSHFPSIQFMPYKVRNDVLNNLRFSRGSEISWDRHSANINHTLHFLTLPSPNRSHTEPHPTTNAPACASGVNPDLLGLFFPLPSYLTHRTPPLPLHGSVERPIPSSSMTKLGNVYRVYAK